MKNEGFPNEVNIVLLVCWSLIRYRSSEINKFQNIWHQQSCQLSPIFLKFVEYSTLYVGIKTGDIYKPSIQHLFILGRIKDKRRHVQAPQSTQIGLYAFLSLQRTLLRLYTKCLRAVFLGIPNHRKIYRKLMICLYIKRSGRVKLRLCVEWCSESGFILLLLEWLEDSISGSVRKLVKSSDYVTFKC